jgi:hypothetical protein
VRTLGSLALYYSKKGQSAQGATFIRRARSIDPKSGSLLYIEATVHAQAGQPEQAIASLRQSFRSNYGLELAESDPELSSLHARPDFKQLIREFQKR